MDCAGLLASAAFFDFWGPVEFFVAGVAEAFGVMLFFFRAVSADTNHHLQEKTFAY